MYVGNGRIVEGWLVLFFKKRSERIGHWIGQEENGKHWQDRVARQGYTACAAGDTMHSLFTDKFCQCVECRHQHNEGWDDARNEAGKDLATLLENTDEIFTRAGEPAKLLFLLDVLQLILEFFDSNVASRLRQHHKVIACMVNGLFAMKRSIRNHRSRHRNMVRGDVSMLRQHC
jgi:hypothetical protein